MSPTRVDLRAAAGPADAQFVPFASAAPSLPHSAARRLAGAVLAAALLTPALPAMTALAADSPSSAGFVTPSLVDLRRHDVPIPKRPMAASRRLAADGTRAAVVAAPAAAPARSTWQVTYTGFEAYPQARAAFQAAVDIWARVVVSSVPIKVDASFTALPAGVLGSAGASAGYPNVGDGQSYYPSALADALAGVDQSPKYTGAPASDITAEFTNATDAGFYFGTDGAPPAGTVDFESVVLHELGHGLGFTGSMDVAGGLGSYSTPLPDRFDRFAEDASGTTVLSRPNSSAELATVLQGGSVYWRGASAMARNRGDRPTMYAPAAWEPGSSFSHLDEWTYGLGNANSLMTPQISAQEAIHSPGPVAVGMLNDLGWEAYLPGAPEAPTGVTATAGNGSAQVSWSAADTGATATQYAVVASPGGARVTVAASTLTATVPDLTAGTAYTFTVTAWNTAGEGPVSAPSNSVVPAPATAPDQVTDVRATGADTGAVVSWTAPASNGSPLTGYVVTPSNSPAVTVNDPAATHLRITGLTNGSSYSFTVQAVNALGTGPESLASNVAVPSGAPTAPGNLVATRARGGSVTLSWTAAAGNGKPVTGHWITVRPGNAVLRSGSAAPGFTVTGLTTGTSYTFAVQALNPNGAGVPSPTSNAVTPDGTAPKLTIGAVPAFSLGTTAPITFSAVDAHSGVARYLVRTRKAAYNGTLGSYGATVSTTAKRYAPAAAKGYTYCHSVAAQDKVGNTSAWSADRCTTIALDDRALSASSSWRRLTSSSPYGATYTSAARSGQTLTLAKASGRRLMVVATTCASCGSVRVTFGGASKTVSLVSKTTKWKALIVVDFGSVRTGAVTLATASSRTVLLDGLGVSRF
ncbi:MAG: hypothetical protein JWN87_846 [Frankiales bacterium]|nr:hypothetical protein [Frankiales bacterium]